MVTAINVNIAGIFLVVKTNYFSSICSIVVILNLRKIKVRLYDMYGKYVDSRSGEEYYKGNMKAG